MIDFLASLWDLRYLIAVAVLVTAGAFAFEEWWEIR